jgi:hypothetical protein
VRHFFYLICLLIRTCNAVLCCRFGTGSGGKEGEGEEGPGLEELDADEEDDYEEAYDEAYQVGPLFQHLFLSFVFLVSPVFTKSNVLLSVGCFIVHVPWPNTLRKHR